MKPRDNTVRSMRIQGFITMQQAAKKHGVHSSTVYGWATRGCVKSQRIGDHFVFVECRSTESCAKTPRPERHRLDGRFPGLKANHAVRAAASKKVHIKLSLPKGWRPAEEQPDVKPPQTFPELVHAIVAREVEKLRKDIKAEFAALKLNITNDIRHQVVGGCQEMFRAFFACGAKP